MAWLTNPNHFQWIGVILVMSVRFATPPAYRALFRSPDVALAHVVGEQLASADLHAVLPLVFGSVPFHDGRTLLWILINPPLPRRLRRFRLHDASLFRQW